jgi:homotetrameric cytidine deaminase
MKLREEQPGGATLVQYDRADEARARLSSYRLVPVADPEELRAALDAGLGTLVVVDKERHLLTLDGVRIHLDTVRDLGTFIELEGVAAEGSDLEPEREKVARLQEALGIGPDRVLTDSYSDRLLGPEALIEAARAVMQRAYAPYSRYVVGAALRADDGSIHVGANVENSAYPQGQCAEASVIAGANEFCVPCGGCRQRLREFMPLDATIHLCGVSGAHETATLGELLPRSFGPEYLPG